MQMEGYDKQMNTTKRIQIIGVGAVPAKPACEFTPGEVIQREHGYTLKVVKIIFQDAEVITFEVEHVPEETEFWDWKYTHQEVYCKSELLGIAKRHGNEGLC